jgi:hypothetical protein
MLFVSLLFALGAEPRLDATSAAVVVVDLDADQLRKLKGLSSAGLQAIGTVSIARAKPADETPILGQWKLAERLSFHPRVPFERGTAYRITVKDAIDATFTIPEKKAEPGRVECVFPRAEDVPANLLRFYIYFAGEMKAGQGYKHFHLLDEKGARLPETFLELDEELWSPDGTRFTLLLHPGRVKRELEPRQSLGPVLEAGKKYTLVIDKEFQTLEGKPLAEEYRKTFKATAAIERGLDPKKWTIAPPKASTKHAVELKFNALMDRALMSRVISVEDAAGKMVEGEKAHDNEETVWRWNPKAEWKPGRYRIVVEDVLEDVCGNRIGAAFDEVLGQVGARHLKEPTKLAFEIK